MKLFRRRQDAAALTLFFATDLHGSEKCFGKFLNAASFYGVDALVLGGDLSGKVIVPIVGTGSGPYSARFLDDEVVVSGDTEVADLERRIRLNGYYPYRCSPEELDELRSDEAKRHLRVEQVVRDDVARWMARADAKLSEANVPCYGIPGNDDDPYVGELLSGSASIVNCEDGVARFDGFQMLGFGYSNPTPWNSPRELPEEELGQRLETLAAELDPERPTIFNVHVPPRNSGLDLAPELDADKRISGGGRMHPVPVGSSAVASAIERHQPLVSLHGHVHESRGTFRLGQTLCLNPGSEYNVGVLRGVIVRLAQDRVVSHQFVAA
jgi:Icc-related predicted phosphoesterase